jgi:hypothetical protein
MPQTDSLDIGYTTIIDELQRKANRLLLLDKDKQIRPRLLYGREGFFVDYL